eukprot:Seg1851.5 transcript_id=Seg1851.5/GoldUCD/mRNA.D3Y31 product="hypothetical protein" protein_id=Seg1851.5/GoldUCD/D3Y31
MVRFTERSANFKTTNAGKVWSITNNIKLQHSKYGKFPWGNEVVVPPHGVMKYTYPKIPTCPHRDDYPTHKHFGTKVIQLEAVKQPYEVTQLLLSDCRKNDQRLPPVNDELIPKNMVPLAECLVPTDPWFLLKPKCAVFPSTYPEKHDREASTEEIFDAQKQMKKNSILKLSQTTGKALTDVNKRSYSTTYLSSYTNPLSVDAWEKTEPRRVSFNEKVTCYEKETEKATTDETRTAKLAEERSEASKETGSSKVSSDETGSAKFTTGETEDTKVMTAETQTAKLAEETSDGPKDTVIVDGVEVCRFCSKRKQTRVELKDVDGLGIKAYQNKTIAGGKTLERKMSCYDTMEDKWAEWPVGNKSAVETPPNYPKIIIQGYNDKPKCPTRFFVACDCDKFPQLKNSILKSEYITNRRASSFARRNYSTISVFHLLKHEGPSVLDTTVNNKESEVRVSSQPRRASLDDPSLNMKSDARARLHNNFPEELPDLRDTKRTILKFVFNGYPSYLFG